MRFFLALAVACVGLLAMCAGNGRAETGTVWDQLPDSNSPDLLVGPGQRRKTDDTRNLSAPPSSTRSGATRCSARAHATRARAGNGTAHAAR